MNALEQLVRNEPHQSMARVPLHNEAAASDSPELRKTAIGYNLAVRSAFERQFESGPSLQVPGVSAAQMAILLLGTVRGIYQQWLLERETFDVVAALRALRCAVIAATGRTPE